LFSVLIARAQEVKKAQPDNIIKVVPILSDGGHTAYAYTIAGKLQTPEDVKIKLLAYAPSAVEFNSARKNIIWSYISVGGFTASSIAAFIAFKNSRTTATPAIVNGEAGFTYQEHSKTGAYVFTTLATGFLFSSLYNLVRAGKHAKSALRLYNSRFE
jgi:hypothetical protein